MAREVLLGPVVDCRLCLRCYFSFKFVSAFRSVAPRRMPKPRSTRFRSALLFSSLLFSSLANSLDGSFVESLCEALAPKSLGDSPPRLTNDCAKGVKFSAAPTLNSISPRGSFRFRCAPARLSRALGCRAPQAAAGRRTGIPAARSSSFTWPTVVSLKWKIEAASAA